MGTNCAPYLANLMLFMFEFTYIKSISAKISAGECSVDLLNQLSHNKRYIDDLWNPVTPNFDSIAKEIYPQSLPLNKEMEGARVNYLDMTTWYDNTEHRWHSKLFDKRVELIHKGMKLNKFPHIESRLTLQCKYGVIGSQLHRFTVANTKPMDFLRSATALYSELYNKSYDTARMNSCFSKFLRRHRNKLHLRPDAIQRRFQFLHNQQN